MATESTPLETIINHRWDGKSGDRETYDLIFDVAILMTKTQDIVDLAVGKLLLQIINDWEKNPRFVTVQTVSSAYDLAREWQDKEQELDMISLEEIWDGAPELEAS